MCKLYIASGPLTTRQVKLALEASNRAFRNSEKDGFGFMASNGLQVSRGRYLNPSGFAGYMTRLPLFLSGPTAEENRLPKNITALVVHGRTSTNLKSLDNVHPFYYKSHYLAHNGMVNWSGPKEHAPRQTCDSDAFLHWLVDCGLSWEMALHFWSGFGAMALYAPKTGILTVARDGAQLHIARRVKEKGWVFATDAKQLVTISKQAGIALDTTPLPFPQHIVDIKDGKIVEDRTWAGFGTRQWTHLDTMAMGKPMDTTKSCVRTFFPDYNPEAK
jgi:hypothetical protein